MTMREPMPGGGITTRHETGLSAQLAGPRVLAPPPGIFTQTDIGRFVPATAPMRGFRR
jgi:hypothetical protein